MIKILVVLGVVLFAAVVVLAMRKPDTFSVRRTASIEAPPERIAAHIADFKRWIDWSPFEKLDPAMRRAFSGPAAGKGSVYAWEGRGKVGAGRMEIAEASPSRITILLDFEKPIEGRSIAAFTLEPRGDATEVTWSMDGPNPFVAKVMQVFVDTEAMLGRDFEAGLADLKAAAEG
ncbi:hypothetical protein BURK1_03613 [Burkholderiales bacterium]|nr:hypothetical protein BURK1_03613 [Burkholderiales bacterium]